MNKRLKTMNLSGSEYAKVPDRIKEFRENCPNGLIETKPTIQEDGQIMFYARILKDKADPNSAEGTGHALGGNKKAKDFEKLETIAVGRALAMLGYMASGEVASSEEMEEFEAYKSDKVDEAIGQLKATETIDSLKEAFMSLGSLMANSKVIAAKDAKKAELSK